MSKYLRNKSYSEELVCLQVQNLVSVVVGKVIEHLITELSKLSINNRLRIENRKDP